MVNVRLTKIMRHAVLCDKCGTVGTRTHEREAEQLKRVHVSQHAKEFQESLNGTNKRNKRV